MRRKKLAKPDLRKFEQAHPPLGPGFLPRSFPLAEGKELKAIVDKSGLVFALTHNYTGRPLDDDGSMLVRYHNGTRGLLYASQISTGDENNLNIRIHGNEAFIEAAVASSKANAA